jgi:hypothetical protein
MRLGNSLSKLIRYGRDDRDSNPVITEISVFTTASVPVLGLRVCHPIGIGDYFPEVKAVAA